MILPSETATNLIKTDSREYFSNRYAIRLKRRPSKAKIVILNDRSFRSEHCAKLKAKSTPAHESKTTASRARSPHLRPAR